MRGSVETRDELLDAAFNDGDVGGSGSHRTCQNGVSELAHYAFLPLLFEVLRTKLKGLLRFWDCHYGDSSVH